MSEPKYNGPYASQAQEDQIRAVRAETEETIELVSAECARLEKMCDDAQIEQMNGAMNYSKSNTFPIMVGVRVLWILGIFFVLFIIFVAYQFIYPT